MFPECHLVSMNIIEGRSDGVNQSKNQALAIRYFDRTDYSPVHIEDFAQAKSAPCERKLEQQKPGCVVRR
jgi:serine/threonine-protein kinase HipA